MKYPITKEEIRRNLQARIDETAAELAALKGVKIDTTHKTLTNRSISGEGARIDNYLSIGKALYVSYTVKTAEHTRYASRDITAYTYNNPDGTEIGSNGFLRISRTMTPTELNDLLQDVKDGLANTIGELKSEYRRADSIARKHNKLVEQINTFNDGLSYAGKAQI